MPAATKKQSTLKRVETKGWAQSEYRPWRSIKMFEPICLICQEVPGGPPYGWWDKCTHNPYFFLADVRVTEPVIEEHDGEKIIVNHITKLVRQETPNIRQVAFEERINNSTGVDRARLAGCKLPEEMGYAPFCQYGDCWSQDINVRTMQYGDYCSELQCKVIIADFDGIPLEVLDDKTRRAQLREILIPSA